MNSPVIVYFLVSLILSLTKNDFVMCRSRHIDTPSNRINGDEKISPLVEALSPKGLRVSIPDDIGIELFAFHGKVNSPIQNLEAGTFSEDVLKPIDGHWVFQTNDIRLQIGDIVNYWVFVQINGTGYRVDNLSSIIRELVPATSSIPNNTNSNNLQEPETTTMSSMICNRRRCRNRHQQQRQQQPTNTQITINDCNKETLDFISTQLNVTLSQLSSLHDKITPLQSQVESQTELLQELIKDMNIGTKLLLTGSTPPGANPLEQARYVITEELQLNDLERKILQAQHTDNGIVLEMSSPIDKKRIQFRAEKRLKHSKYHFEDIKETTHSEIMDIDVRASE